MAEYVAALFSLVWFPFRSVDSVFVLFPAGVLFLTGSLWLFLKLLNRKQFR